LLPLALVVGIIAVNFRFYAFFLGRRQLLLLSMLLPLHLLYYLYCGFSFGMGLAFHLWKNRILPMLGIRSQQPSKYTQV
jgi:hypothetical protein